MQWNACDYTLQFNFKLTHIADSVNTSADCLSRLELKVTEKICLLSREGLQTTQTEVTATSSHVADEEQFFLTQPSNDNESEKNIFEKQEKSCQAAEEGVAKEEPSSLRKKHQRGHKDGRKHYVVNHERKQIKCTKTSRARR